MKEKKRRRRPPAVERVHSTPGKMPVASPRRPQQAPAYGAEEEILAAQLDQCHRLLEKALATPHEVNVTIVESGAIAILASSTVYVTQSPQSTLEARKVEAGQGETGQGLKKTAKRTALDLIGSTIRDVAKDKIKEAARVIIKLVKHLGPVIISAGACALWQSMGRGA